MSNQSSCEIYLGIPCLPFYFLRRTTKIFRGNGGKQQSIRLLSTDSNSIARKIFVLERSLTRRDKCNKRCFQWLLDLSRFLPIGTTQSVVVATIILSTFGTNRLLPLPSDLRQYKDPIIELHHWLLILLDGTALHSCSKRRVDLSISMPVLWLSQPNATRMQLSMQLVSEPDLLVAAWLTHSHFEVTVRS